MNKITYEERAKVYANALDTYGLTGQLMKVLEELTEINMIATLISGNDLGFIGEARAGLLLEEQIKTKEQVAKALADDAKSDPSLTHTKADLARRVKQILGRNWNKYKYLFHLLADYW